MPSLFMLLLRDTTSSLVPISAPQVPTNPTIPSQVPTIPGPLSATPFPAVALPSQIPGPVPVAPFPASGATSSPVTPLAHHAAQNAAIVWSWIGVQIAGQVLLLLLLLTLLFSRRLKTQRHPIVINFVLTWLVSTVPALLLLYNGKEIGPEPSPTLCLFSAALLAGVPPMEAVAFLAVIVQIFLLLRNTLQKKPYSPKLWLVILLIGSPYAAFVIFGGIVGIFGYLSPQDVSRDPTQLYCTVSHHFLGETVWGFTSVVVSATFFLQSCIAVIVYRNWRSVKGNRVRPDLNTHFLFRVAAFAVYELLIVATSLVTIFNANSVPPQFMEAFAPLIVFVILGSQPDVFFSWFPCLRRESPSPVPPMSAKATQATFTNALQERKISAPVAAFKFPGTLAQQSTKVPAFDSAVPVSPEGNKEMRLVLPRRSQDNQSLRSLAPSSRTIFHKASFSQESAASHTSSLTIAPLLRPLSGKQGRKQQSSSSLRGLYLVSSKESFVSRADSPSDNAVAPKSYQGVDKDVPPLPSSKSTEDVSAFAEISLWSPTGTRGLTPTTPSSAIARSPRSISRKPVPKLEAEERKHRSNKPSISGEILEYYEEHRGKLV